MGDQESRLGMNCFECGELMEKRVVPMWGIGAARNLKVTVEAMVCAKCGYTTLHASELGAYYKKTEEAVANN